MSILERFSERMSNIGQSIANIPKNIKQYIEGRPAQSRDGRMELYPAPPRQAGNGEDGSIQKLGLGDKIINGVFGVTAAPLIALGYAPVAAYKNSLLDKQDDIKSSIEVNKNHIKQNGIEIKKLEEKISKLETAMAERAILIVNLRENSNEISHVPENMRPQKIQYEEGFQRTDEKKIEDLKEKVAKLQRFTQMAEKEIKAYEGKLINTQIQLDNFYQAGKTLRGEKKQELAAAQNELREAKQALQDHLSLGKKPSTEERVQVANLKFAVQLAEQKIVDLKKIHRGEKPFIPGAKFKDSVEVLKYEKISDNFNYRGEEKLKGDSLKAGAKPPRLTKPTIEEIKNKENININHINLAAENLIRKAIDKKNLITSEEKAIPVFFQNSVVNAFFKVRGVKPDENGNYDLSTIKENVLSLIRAKRSEKVIVQEEAEKNYAEINAQVEEIEKKLEQNSNDIELKKELKNLKEERATYYNDKIGMLNFLKTYDDLVPLIDPLFDDGDFQEIANKFFSARSDIMAEVLEEDDELEALLRQVPESRLEAPIKNEISEDLKRQIKNAKNIESILKDLKIPIKKLNEVEFSDLLDMKINIDGGLYSELELNAAVTRLATMLLNLQNRFSK